MSKTENLAQARARLTPTTEGYNAHEVDVFFDRLVSMYANGLQPSPTALVPRFSEVDSDGYDKEEVDLIVRAIFEDELTNLGVDRSYGLTDSSTSHTWLLGVAVGLAALVVVVLLVASLIS